MVHCAALPQLVNKGSDNCMSSNLSGHTQCDSYQVIFAFQLYLAEKITHPDLCLAFIMGPGSLLDMLWS